jgi:tryptophan synthase alpha chain
MPGKPGAAAARRFSADLSIARRDRRALLGVCLPAGWRPAADGGGGGAAYRLAGAAADVVELAAPADPAPLDGPVMAGAYRETLAAGWMTGWLPAWVRAVRRGGGASVLVMAYWPVIASYGPARFARGMALAGAAGIVIPDLPPGLAPDWADAVAPSGLHTILMAGHPARGSGAVYCPAAPGRTGTAAAPYPGLARMIGQARAAAGLPVIAGVGITPDRARLAADAGADVVLAGSALVAAMRARPDSPLAAAGQFLARFRAGLRGEPGTAGDNGSTTEGGADGA